MKFCRPRFAFLPTVQVFHSGQIHVFTTASIPALDRTPV